MVNAPVTVNVVSRSCGFAEQHRQHQAGQVPAVNAAIAVQVGAVCGGSGIEIQGNDHRVMVRGPVSVRCVEAGLLLRRLELGVVVQGSGLIGIDRPDGGIGNFAGQGGIGQSVVQVACLAIEHVGIRLLANVGRHWPGREWGLLSRRR